MIIIIALLLSPQKQLPENIAHVLCDNYRRDFISRGSSFCEKYNRYDDYDNNVVITGTTLSGGQKQRLALARVIYSKTQTILLDDPFSALDNDVALEV